MSAALCDAEIRAIFARKPPPDPDLMAGYATGEIATCPAIRRADRGTQRYGGRFARRRYQRSPDREKSIQRRRQLAASGCMPPALASQLTTGEQACARIIVDEIVTHGRCDRSLDEIAARAGVCHKTAQRAVRRLSDGKSKITGLRWIAVEARPVDGRKHLPNVIMIVSPEWLTWIARGPIRARIIGGQLRPTTVNVFTKICDPRSSVLAERPQEVSRGSKFARSRPPPTLIRRLEGS
jgi:hypothetical protein